MRTVRGDRLLRVGRLVPVCFGTAASAGEDFRLAGCCSGGAAAAVVSEPGLGPMPGLRLAGGRPGAGDGPGVVAARISATISGWSRYRPANGGAGEPVLLRSDEVEAEREGEWGPAGAGVGLGMSGGKNEGVLSRAARAHHAGAGTRKL